MDISSEELIDQCNKWLVSSAPLRISVTGHGLAMYLAGRVKGVSDDVVDFALDGKGSAHVMIAGATRVRSMGPDDPPPPDVGGSHKGCLVFVVINLNQGGVCNICEFPKHADYPIQRTDIVS
jgi:hypothetical protein